MFYIIYVQYNFKRAREQVKNTIILSYYSTIPLAISA